LAVLEKFKDSGFILARGTEENNQEISIICFKRKKVLISTKIWNEKCNSIFLF